MDLNIFCTCGTFDKIYFDALSDYQIGEPQIEWIMTQANVDFDYAIESIIKKDSLEISEQDRAEIVTAVTADNCERIIIIHGTDTMPETATALQGLTDKTIVLVGAMQPARFRDSDALFNSGFAVAAARLLPVGVYIAMNGQIFNADQVQKNREAGLFEAK